jgi:hypothetical protein
VGAEETVVKSAAMIVINLDSPKREVQVGGAMRGSTASASVQIGDPGPNTEPGLQEEITVQSTHTKPRQTIHSFERKGLA